MQIDFKDMVSALAKDGADILVTLTPEKCHLLHMAVGISGEASELLDANLDDMKNIIEELGDIEFYLEGLRQGLNATNPYLPDGRLKRKNSVRRTIQILAGDILDTVKKYVIYNQDLREQDLHALINGLTIELRNAYVTFNITRDQVIAANIEKLGKRYSAGSYSDNDAQQRKDKCDA